MTPPTTGAVCVVGSFMMDLVASAPRRPRAGETLIGTAFSTHLGGKGFNQAVAAARAGARTSIVGHLGVDDFADAFRTALTAEGIDDGAVLASTGVGTGVGLPVVEPDGQNSIIIVPRANSTVTAEHVRRHGDLIAAADVVLLQLELPIDAVVEAASIAREAATTVIVNPAPYSPDVDRLRGLVDVVVPNEVELVGLDGGRNGEAAGTTHVENAARRVQKRWETDLVVTVGSAGSLVVTDGGEVSRVAAHDVVAVDTIGAGDTFCAYLGVGLAEAGSLVAAATLANAAAGLAVTRRGGAESAPRRDEVSRALSGATPAAVPNPVPTPAQEDSR